MGNREWGMGNRKADFPCFLCPTEPLRSLALVCDRDKIIGNALPELVAEFQ